MSLKMLSALVLCLFAVLPGSFAQEYQTENVFIVVIDGLRNEEAFEEPSYQYIPYLWYYFRPLGTIYTEFYNDSRSTITTPAHETIVTGQWHLHPNLFRDEGDEIRYDIRPEAPTVFEYFRKFKSAALEDCLIMLGKGMCLKLNWSLDPEFGPGFDAPDPGEYWQHYSFPEDDDVYRELQLQLQANHPKLVLINFPDVDTAAHKFGEAVYHQAILDADRHVYNVWTHLIQGDPVYANKTTMLVTSDHGRDAFSPPKDHGGMSHQNRHVFFLAIGPDTPAGQACTDKRFQIDIVPTVAALLGIDATRLARGQVLTAMFSQPPGPRIYEHQKNPRIASRQGYAAVVWSENSPDDTGNDGVYLRYKLPGGPFTTAPTRISSATAPPDGPRWAYFPDVTINSHGCQVVWLDSRIQPGHEPDPEEERWSIYYRRTLDFVNWEAEKVIDTSTWETPPPDSALEILGNPRIMSNNAGEMIVAAKYAVKEEDRTITCYTSTDGFVNSSEGAVYEQGATGRRFPLNYSVLPLTSPLDAVVVWQDFAPKPLDETHYGWEIFSIRTQDGGLTWNNQHQLTIDSDYSYTPRVAWNGQRLVCVWASLGESGETPWTLRLLSSDDQGASWNPVNTLVPRHAVWQPDIVWDPNVSKFCLVWADYGTPSGEPDLKYSKSSTGSSWSWSVPANVLPSSGVRCNPRVAYDSDSANRVVRVVWEEYDADTHSWTVQDGVLP